MGDVVNEAQINIFLEGWFKAENPKWSNYSFQYLLKLIGKNNLVEWVTNGHNLTLTIDGVESQLEILLMYTLKTD